MNGDAPLRRCPKCGGKWPDDDTHSLRSLRFMDNLPRGITPMNLDAVAIHNGPDGDAVYLFEIKLPHEPWPMSVGQLRALRAMAKWNGSRVFVIRGTEQAFDIYQVLPLGLSKPERVTGTTLHGWLDTWLGEKAA